MGTLLREQKGTSLLETLLAVAILGTIGSVFISALFSGYRTSGNLDEDATIERLARNQLEAIKNASYDITAPYEYPIVEHPAHYPVSVDVESVWDNTRQDITITVSYEGKTLISVDTFRVEGL
jgi:type II secretory pathway pseudopilin PulG